MKRLVFIVEGNTEVNFVYQHIIPYLLGKGFNNTMQAQTILTNPKKYKKGGVLNYEYLKNDINRTRAQGNVLVTSLIDFYALPTSFPNFSNDKNRIGEIERGMHEDLDNTADFIPYIQLHEVESLMFSDTKGFEFVVDEDYELQSLKEIIAEYSNPEDINNSYETAPSKRMEKIFGYDKGADGELIFNKIGIESILEKCPRFAEWIGKIESALSEFQV